MIKRERGSESGQGLIEYGLILVLIAIVVIFAIYVWPIPKLRKPRVTPTATPDVTLFLTPDVTLFLTPITEIHNESEIKEIIETGSIVQIVETETTLLSVRSFIGEIPKMW